MERSRSARVLESSSRFSVAYQFAMATILAGDHRQTTGHGLGQTQPQPLLPAGAHRDVRNAGQFGHVATEAEQLDVITHTQCRRLFTHGCLQGTIASQQ